MADWLSPHNPDEAFLLSEANGFRSRGTVKLKAGAAYQAGSVLKAEETTVGGVTTATGFHVLSDGSDAKLVILCRYTDATAEATEAAVIESDAEVKPGELTFKQPTTPVKTKAGLATLALAGIKAR